MAEGLNIQVAADVTQAEKALDKLSREVKTTANTISTDFNRAVNTGTRALDKLPQSSNRATFALNNFGRVVQDAPFGILGIANNIDPLLLSLQQLKKETGSTGGALKALGNSLLGFGGLALGVSLVTSALVVFGDRLFKTSKAAQEAEEKAKKLKDTIAGIFDSVGKEAAQVGALTAVLRSETETRERKIAALKELKAIQPDIFADLKLEGDVVRGLDIAYKNYFASLKTVVAAKIKQAQLEQKISDLLKLEGATLTSTEKKYKNFVDAIQEVRIETSRGPSGVSSIGIAFEKEAQKVEQEKSNITADISQLMKDIEELSKGIKLKSDPDATQKEIDKIIAEGKRLADELRKIGFIAPEFNFFDTQAQQLEKAKKVISDFANGILKIDPEFFKIPLEIQAPRPEAIKQELNQLEDGIQRGFINRPIQLPIELNERQSQNARVIQEFQDIAARQGLRLQIPVDLDLEGSMYTTARLMNEELSKMQNRLRFATEGANALSNAFQGLFSAILQGENPLKAFFMAINQEIFRLISQLIAAQIRALILRAILGGASGGFGAGAAAIGRIGGRITGFAAGGIVSGPTLALVGEGVGTSRSNPEVIAPLDQLRSILESVVSGRGGDGSAVLSARIRGNDLLLSGSRTSRRNRRLGSG